MGNRLTKIYTRTGDDGSTGLGTGERVRKDCARVEAYGTVDELNCCIGLLLASPDLPASISASLQAIQHRLFDLGGELAVPGRDVILAADTTDLEVLLDTLNADLPPLKDFILPGGTPKAAALHVARTICRRAERSVVHLGLTDDVPELFVIYLNRLSDLLFTMARLANHRAGVGDVTW